MPAVTSRFLPVPCGARTFAWVLLVALCGWLPATAAAWVQTTTCEVDPAPTSLAQPCGPSEVPRPVSWSQPCLSYVLHDGGLDGFEDFGRLVEILRASFETWNEVSCSSLQMGFGGFTDDASIGIEPLGRNTVVFDNDRAVWNARRFGQNIQAITLITFRVSTGEAVDADVIFNSSPAPSGAQHRFGEVLEAGDRGTTDIQNTMTHEAGHFLALAHTTDVNFAYPLTEVIDTTMFESAIPGQFNKRDLHPDDIEGVCAIYPAVDSTCTCRTNAAGNAVTGQDCPDEPEEPTARRRKGCNAAGGAAAGWGMVGVLVVVAGGRRRRVGVVAVAACVVVGSVPVESLYAQAPFQFDEPDLCRTEFDQNGDGTVDIVREMVRENGRLVREELRAGTSTSRFEHEYDDQGRVAQVRAVPGDGAFGASVFLNWEADRLVGARWMIPGSANARPTVQHERYRYDAAGRLIEALRSDANEVVTARVVLDWYDDGTLRRQAVFNDRETLLARTEHVRGDFEELQIDTDGNGQIDVRVTWLDVPSLGVRYEQQDLNGDGVVDWSRVWRGPETMREELSAQPAPYPTATSHVFWSKLLFRRHPLQRDWADAWSVEARAGLPATTAVRLRDANGRLLEESIRDAENRLLSRVVHVRGCGGAP